MIISVWHKVPGHDGWYKDDSVPDWYARDAQGDSPLVTVVRYHGDPMWTWEVYWNDDNWLSGESSNIDEAMASAEAAATSTKHRR